MTTTAFPTQAHARRILGIGAVQSDGSRKLLLDNGADVFVTKSMLSAYTPIVGDYYVVPSEGHPYMTSKNNYQVTY